MFTKTPTKQQGNKMKRLSSIVIICIFLSTSLFSGEFDISCYTKANEAMALFEVIHKIEKKSSGYQAQSISSTSVFRINNKQIHPLYMLNLTLRKNAKNFNRHLFCIPAETIKELTTTIKVNHQVNDVCMVQVMYTHHKHHKSLLS